MCLLSGGAAFCLSAERGGGSGVARGGQGGNRPPWQKLCPPLLPQWNYTLYRGLWRVAILSVGQPPCSPLSPPWHLNFRQISHRFTSSFTNPSFQDLNGSHIMYWNMMILNPSRFKVEPHSKYWYFCIERVDLLSLRFSENAVLFYI